MPGTNSNPENRDSEISQKPSNDDNLTGASFIHHADFKQDGMALLESITTADFRKEFQKLHVEMDFSEYLAMVKQAPERSYRSSFEFLQNAFDHYGYKEVEDFGTKFRVPSVLIDDPFGDGSDRIIGNYEALAKITSHVGEGADKLGAHKSLLVMIGAPGSAKSTISRLLKRTFEAYSKTDEGALFSFDLKVPRKIYESNNPETVVLSAEDKKDLVAIPAPIHENPLDIIPVGLRKGFEEVINKDRSDSEYQLTINGKVTPKVEYYLNQLLNMYDGDFKSVIANGHITVKRYQISESNQSGIGTVEPKDDKDFDSGELTGDINFRKLAQRGSDSHPDVFDYDGAFLKANYGMLECIELLKYPEQKQHEFLTLASENEVKPKKSAHIQVRTFVLGHTNGFEWARLLKDDSREAIKDRIVPVVVNPVLNYKQEEEIYEKGLTAARKKMHFAPHAVECLAFFTTSTRLEDSDNPKLNRVVKAKLYSGKSVEGFTRPNIKEIMEETPLEGWRGLSARYGQRMIGAAVKEARDKVLSEGQEGYVGFPQVAMLIEKQVKGSQKLDAKTKEKYLSMLEDSRHEYRDLVNKDVRQAIAGDTEEMQKVCDWYTDLVRAWVENGKIEDALSGETISREAIEKRMRPIEMAAGISESLAPEFRKEIYGIMAKMALDGKKFEVGSRDNVGDKRLEEGITEYLFRTAGAILTPAAIISQRVQDEKTLRKIDAVIDRLKARGYNKTSARDALMLHAAQSVQEDDRRR